MSRKIMSSAFSAAALFAAMSVVGCGPGAAEPPRLSGHYGPGPVERGALRTAEERPEGAAPLGELRTRCRAEARVTELHHVTLADVDCSEAELLRALFDRAAEIGADLLIAPICEKDEYSKGTAIACHARVARTALGTEGFEPLPAVPPSPFAVPADAFRVNVTALFSEAEQPRKPIDADQVAELAFVPPGRIVRADLLARGDEDARRDAVRYALRAAAGRIGATAIAEISCAPRKRGFACTGRATRPEIDE